MPVMELVLDRRYNNQQCISKYNYVASGIPSSVTLSFALASAFGVIPNTGIYPSNTPFQTLQAMQNAGVTYLETIVKDLYSVTDFYTAPFLSGVIGTGGAASGALAAYEAYAFRTNRVRSDINRGHKRYEGVAESAVDAYGVVASAAMPTLDAHAEKLSEVLTYDDEGNTITFAPCIIKLKREGTPETGYDYVKWPTEAEQLANLAQGVEWSALNTTTTQNSRKVGRGS